jgi:hypothetical protein
VDSGPISRVSILRLRLSTSDASSTVAQRPSFAHQVDTAILTATSGPECSYEAPDDAPEDSASWLEVSPDELDGMMMRASGRKPGESNPKGDGQKIEIGEEHGQALGDLAKKVEAFVGGEGDLEGARFQE